MLLICHMGSNTTRSHPAPMLTLKERHCMASSSAMAPSLGDFPLCWWLRSSRCYEWTDATSPPPGLLRLQACGCETYAVNRPENIKMASSRH